MRKYEMTVSVTSTDGYQVFACEAGSEAEAVEKFKRGESDIIESCVEVLGLEREPYDVVESDDITSRLSGDVLAEAHTQGDALRDALENLHGKLITDGRRYAASTLRAAVAQLLEETKR